MIKPLGDGGGRRCASDVRLALVSMIFVGLLMVESEGRRDAVGLGNEADGESVSVVKRGDGEEEAEGGFERVRKGEGEDVGSIRTPTPLFDGGGLTVIFSMAADGSSSHAGGGGGGGGSSSSSSGGGGGGGGMRHSSVV